MNDGWHFRITLVEKKSRRFIVEGTARCKSLVHCDEVPFYVVMGEGFIKLDTARDSDGERLIGHFEQFFGKTAAPARIEVGGRWDDDTATLLSVDWEIAAGRSAEFMNTLTRCLAQEVVPLEEGQFRCNRRTE